MYIGNKTDTITAGNTLASFLDMVDCNLLILVGLANMRVIVIIIHRGCRPACSWTVPVSVFTLES